jgi:ShK domain-like
MHLNCQRSCGLCQDEEKDRDQDDSCVDKHSNCQTWGEEMECYANPAYMSGACPATCGICVNVHDLQKQGLSQEEIRQRQQFAETDFGLWQAIPKDSSNADAVREHIRDMGRYIQQLQDEGRIGRGTACNNQYHDCAKWAAADTNDCESNINFMISHCSLICQYCHVVEQYHTCRQKKRSESEKPFHNVASVRTNLMTTYSGATNLAEGTCSASNAQSDNDAEWVVSLEWRDLWGDDATVERATNELMKMLKNDKFEWIDDRVHKDIAAVTYDGNEAMDRSGQILTISHQLSSEQPFQDFISRISQMLQIPRQNLEIEFVRYYKGERHAAHADYRIHDSWKPSGSRVLSIYVVLQRPDQGGNFGFPALHWLLVDNPKVLVWPNVRVEGDSIKPLSKLENEQLPVVDGELYAAHLWVHEYTFDPFGKCELGLK